MRAVNHVLVLGGAGFLGGHLVEALRADAIDATVLTRTLPHPRHPAAAASLIHEHVTRDSVAAALRRTGCDLVVHLAGPSFVPPSIADPITDLRHNAETTLAVLEAIRAASRPPFLVYVSSAAVYGNGRRMPMDETHPLEPCSPYGVAKLACEHYVRLYSRLYGLAACSVRPFSVYGPWQRKLVIHDLATRLLEHETELVVAAPAEVSRDYVYGPDAAHAIVALARRATGIGEAYNIATGIGTTLAELCEQLIAACGVDATATFSGTLRAGDPLRWAGDPARAAAFGAGCPTAIRTGLGATISWLRAELAQDQPQLPS